MYMDDVQNRPDHRAIPVDQVGIAGLRYPILVLDKSKQFQNTVARVTMSVNLPHQFKGTHMSRFVEVLNHYRGEVTIHTIPAMLRELKQRLAAESARIQIVFPYFLERVAPVSGSRALMDYECWFVGETNCNREDFVLGVRVPVTSLCPCSKAISDYGAHNQRGFVTLEIRSVQSEGKDFAFIWIEELIDVVERSASAPVYALLKRQDERYVTMLAYDNPAFVEDIVRNVVTQLREDQRVAWLRVEALNQESIHNHDAFAKIEWSRSGVPGSDPL
jgi:GTP cyclohydrolase I